MSKKKEKIPSLVTARLKKKGWTDEDIVRTYGEGEVPDLEIGQLEEAQYRYIQAVKAGIAGRTPFGPPNARHGEIIEGFTIQLAARFSAVLDEEEAMDVAARLRDALCEVIHDESEGNDFYVSFKFEREDIEW